MRPASCIGNIGIVFHVVHVDTFVASIQLFAVMIGDVYCLATADNTRISSVYPAVAAVISVRVLQLFEP